MFKKLLKHFSISWIFFILTLVQQYLFYYIQDIPIVWLTFGKYLGTFAFFFAASFIRPSSLRYFFLSFVFLLNFFQMAHLSYFGTQILPNEFYLLITQLYEIQGTLLQEFHHVIVPLVFTLIPAAIGFLALRKTQGLYGIKWIGILFCLYFIYNPVRTFITGNTWGRQPSTRELSGMNVYLAFSYFSGRILPHKMFQGSDKKSNNSSLDLEIISKDEPEWDNIVFVLGESLSPHHMSLYGYEKETTPFLDSLKNNSNFFHTIGLSGGVSTDIAVAFLLNVGFGEVGSLKAAKGHHCLFKLSKSKKYTTHFLSSQSAQQLRYIAPYLCASSLNDYRSLEDISPEIKNDQAADDKVLIPELQKLVGFKTKQFIMLHQRGSHGPWELRSLAENRKFPHDNRIGHYDNSIVEFDLFMKELSEVLSKSTDKTLVLYVSDHGEALGQNGKWGHGQLIRESFEVPVIMMSFNKALPAEVKHIPKYAPHYNLSLFLANQLGFETSQDFRNPPKDYVIFGNDIDGFAGKADISFNADGTYNFKVSN